MLQHLRTSALVVAAALFGLILNGYLMLQNFLAGHFQAGKAKLAVSCPDPAIPVVQENPNKILFISCGGFID